MMKIDKDFLSRLEKVAHESALTREEKQAVRAVLETASMPPTAAVPFNMPDKPAPVSPIATS